MRASAATGRSYWIVHGFGPNATFSELDYLRFGPTRIPAFGPGRSGSVTLHSRGATADGDTWSSADLSDQVSGGTAGFATFDDGNGQTSFGQYALTFQPTAPSDSTSGSSTFSGAPKQP